MPTLLHCADLHLSRDEQEYGESVLREILTHARDCDALLLCGDTFDSFADLEALQPRFVELTAEILGADTAAGEAGHGAARRDESGEPNGGSPCRVLLLPGNHEYLRAPKGVAPGHESPFARRSWGRIEVLDAWPFGHTRLQDGDIISIPHSDGYSSYPEWEIPERSGSWRIVMAHAAVIGLHYLGPAEEPDGGAMDPDIFRHCRADYAAMGHIHRAAAGSFGTARVAFPGSARVWRKHETGPRQVLRLQTGNSGVSAERIVLQSAGEFRTITAAVELDGSCTLPRPDTDITGNDWVHIQLSGVVENDKVIDDQLPGLTRQFKARTVSTDRSEVLVLRGIRENAFVQRFEERWRQRAKDAGAEEAELLLRARAAGLREIYSLLQEQT
ncbi:MAG: metallophosphoesterase family protein [Spirochaeta sp.]